MFSYLIEHNRYCSLIGIVIVLICGYIFSNNRAAVKFKVIFNSLLLQFFIGFFILRVPLGARIFTSLANGIGKLYTFAEAGVSFVFGGLTNPAASHGFIFAVKVLPIIIFFGAFMSLLFHLKLIQKVVKTIGFVVRPLLATTGVETICAISNSFLGQTEAPLLIRNYLHSVTKSELFVVMVSGFATISGAILVVYSAIGVPTLHLLAASFMAIPGSICMAKLFYPETEAVDFKKEVQEMQPETKNILDAIAVGTTDGLNLALNVGAMLIAFIGLIAALNYMLGVCSNSINSLLQFLGYSNFVFPILSLNVIFSLLFSPFAYLLGFSGETAQVAAELLGTKLTINEFIAFDKLTKIALSYRAKAILTYALCGFANFSCIGIQIGGIGALVPSKRQCITELGLRALAAATATNFISALIANLLI